MKFSSVSLLLSVAVSQAADSPIHFVGKDCVDYDPNEAGWTNLGFGKDLSDQVDIGFQFDFFGKTFSKVGVVDNGYITLGALNTDSLPDGFNDTDGLNRIAPFWADVDNTATAVNVTNKISYKTKGDRFIVVWNEVLERHSTANLTDYQAGLVADNPEYDTDDVPLTNTFSLVISDKDSDHPKVCFCYCKMEWAHADVNAGGTNVPLYPATVGFETKSFSDHGLDANAEPWVYGRFNYGKLDANYAKWDGIGTVDNGVQHLAGRSFCFDPSTVKDTPLEEDVGVCGDPHFKTWKNEHFEYHGQCDLVVAKDPKFADGLGLDVHIRTKVVRFWSYIKNAVIRIGDDILEIEGSSMEGIDKEVHYWFNYEYQGELTEFAGFPVTISSEGTKSNKNRITIDLSSKYPGQKITLSTFKEFVKVNFGNASVQAFGNTVGILGDFNTGKTLARDGATVLDDFTELGHEWQVLPSDGKFFRASSDPQFPKKCIEPENPRGERRRKLSEATVSLEQAEAACAELKSALDRKDCVYDILATQDLDMAGAF